MTPRQKFMRWLRQSTTGSASYDLETRTYPNAPTGYRYKTVKGHGKLLIPDEPLASLVKEGLEGFASGRFQTQVEVKRFFETCPDFPRNKHGQIIQ